jgi:hypothetical protein
VATASPCLECGRHSDNLQPSGWVYRKDGSMVPSAQPVYCEACCIVRSTPARREEIQRKAAARQAAIQRKAAKR